MQRSGQTASSALPAILEDESTHATPRTAHMPPRLSNRPAHNHFGLGLPPVHSHERSPPAYSHVDIFRGIKGPSREKLVGLRNNRHISNRGGWGRVALLILVIILCVVGLVSGLVFGLRNRHQRSSTSENGAGDNLGGASGNAAGEPSNSTFPAGSYSIETYLNLVNTNCTSNPTTWLCNPYETYAESPSGSAATFDWIIDPVHGTDNYTISSTHNYFSIVFTDTNMSLEAAGTDLEHYSFQISMQKPVIPDAALTPSDVSATCYYNNTILQAYLYTKMPKTYPPNSTINNSSAFTAWPYAVRVEQLAQSGPDTPTCLDRAGNSLGDYSIEETGQICDCVYINTGT